MHPDVDSTPRSRGWPGLGCSPSVGEPRIAQIWGHASSGPTTHALASFVEASAKVPTQAWVQEPSYAGPRASHFQMSDFIGPLTRIDKDSSWLPCWV